MELGFSPVQSVRQSDLNGRQRKKKETEEKEKRNLERERKKKEREDLQKKKVEQRAKKQRREQKWLRGRQRRDVYGAKNDVHPKQLSQAH